MVRNPLLKYTVMNIVKNANTFGAKYFKQYHFYKILFLVYIELLKVNVDIKLPYSWYLFGDLPDTRTYEHMTGGSLGYYTPAQGFLPKINQLPELGIDFEIRKKIDDIVKSEFSKITMDGRFKKNYGDILLNSTYKEAPFEFQRVFNRGLLNYLEKFRIECDQSTLMTLCFDFTELNHIGHYLDELMVVYPDGEVSEIYDMFLEWEDTVRLAMLDDHSLVIDLVDKFWEVFCGILRTKKNENILPEIVDQWKKEFSHTILPDYKVQLEKNRKKLLLKHFEANPPGQKTRDTVNKIMKLARDLATEKQEPNGA